MIRRSRCCFLVLLFLAGMGHVRAEATLPEWRFVAQLDNDLFAGTDRDYTSGVRFALLRELSPDQATHSLLQRALYRVSSLGSRALGGGSRLEGNPLRFSWGVGLTQLMHTPEDPTLALPPSGERPYAGWLGAEFTLNASDENSVGGLTLSIGTTGSNSFAQEAQDWVHLNISDSPIFRGWDSQVPGELTLNLHFDHKEKIEFLRPTEAWLIEFDGYYEGGFALGNFRTNAYVGTLFRSGINLPSSYATPRVELGTYGHPLFEEERNEGSLSVYGFAGVRGTAVLHDITLDGPVFRDYGSAVGAEPFVGELLLGFASHFKGAVFSFSHSIRTREFDQQRSSQRYGSVMLSAGWKW